ncbi:MAG: nitroreductase [Deltaproteobacteria bacterium]|nr:nitroreductase [Deltaproteobacteria bacterium]MBW2053775.1 nitroreductase [Deltaproteobacteria bacterium]MBW2142496.1 nitroreductase [Deltaproteobacteria bacterium]
MDLIEAIRTRKSVRGYKADPVDKGILRELLEVATRAPSADNSQPWEIVAVTGEVLENIKRGNVEALKSGKTPTSDAPRTPYKDVYRERQVELAAQLFKLMDISREDKEKRNGWMLRGFRFFDAPAAFILYADRSLDPTRAASDIGGLAQTICLAALNYGLGTCIASQGTMFPEVVRQFTNIPESKHIYWCITIGYPDWNFPANAVNSKRAPVDKVTNWLGFD